MVAGTGAVASASTPISCGAKIDRPGRYFLSASCACTGNGTCILVNSHNVTISLNNRTLACRPRRPAAADNDATFGIQATSVENFALIGCDSVASCRGKITGCYIGVLAGHDNNLFIDRVNLSGNTYVAVDTSYSKKVRITRNTIDGVAGYLGPGQHNAYAIGINGCGTGCEVIANVFKNIVTQIKAVPPLVGEGASIIQSAKVKGAHIAYNWFESVAEQTRDIGIRVGEDGSAIVEHNTFTGFWHAVSGPGDVTVTNNRILLRNPEAFPTSIGIYGGSGAASGNLIVNYRTPIDEKVKDDGTNLVVTPPRSQ